RRRPPRSGWGGGGGRGPRGKTGPPAPCWPPSGRPIGRTRGSLFSPRRPAIPARTLAHGRNLLDSGFPGRATEAAMVGQTVGKYRVVSRLGRGGMGTVYKAVDETLDREVAIKCLNAELGDPDLLKRFRGEAGT